MSLLRQTEVSAFGQAEWDQAAAERATGFGQYLGAKLSGGFDRSLAGRALETVAEPPRITQSYTDELGQTIEPPVLPGQTALGEDAWKSSPFYREGMSYDVGMTRELAEVRAQAFDRRRWRDSLVARYQGGPAGQAVGFLAEIAGGAVSPENFIPFVGPGMRAAAVARLGVIGGHAAAAAADATIGTALADAVVLPDLARRGEDVGIADFALDLALGAAVGGVFGVGGGVLERRGLMREAARATRIDGIQTALDQLNVVADAIAHDEPIPAIVGIEQRLREKLTGRAAPEVAARGLEPVDVEAVLPQEWIERTALRLEQGLGFEPADARIEALVHAALRDERGGLLDAAGIAEDAFAVAARDLPGRAAEGAGERAAGPGAGEPGAAGRAGEAAGAERATGAEPAAAGAGAARAERGAAAARTPGRVVGDLAGLAGEPGVLARGGDAAEALGPAAGREAVAARAVGAQGQGPALQRGLPAEALGRRAAATADIARQVRTMVTAEREPPLPASVIEAAKRAGKRPADDAAALRELAQDMGVLPKEGGDIPEMADVNELRRQGRVQPQEEAALVRADELVKEADGWAMAYEQLAVCSMRYES
jgi:hypothetical protein